MDNSFAKTGLSAVMLAFGLSACAGSSGPPSDIENACSIMQEREGWYQAARRAAKKWKAPTPTLLAIIWRESRFQPEAETPRQYALGVIPWGRQSSAYGFAQAIDGTWEWYQNDIDNDDADRTDFADAVDFVGWYMNKSRKRLGLSRHDPQTHYLAYHEGHSGFKSGRWRDKAFLVKASQQVARMASLYDAQLRECDAEYARERRLARTPLPTPRPFALAEVGGSHPVRKPGSSTPRIIRASMRTLPLPKPTENRGAKPFVLPDGV